MLLTVDDFCTRARRDMGKLVHELQDRTGRFGDAERNAWERSLRLVAQVLRRTKLGDVHIHFQPPPSLSLEYRLPASSSWCDAVLLGRSAEQPAAEMMELKDWDTTGDGPGPREGLVRHQGRLTLHPGEQLRGYVEYCRRFHSAVHESKAEVGGCVFLTHARRVGVYQEPPHDRLAAEFPLFASSEEDLLERLPRDLESRLTAPDQGFAQAFESLHGDPLAEVGCPYVIRGFDYDYLGILWMSDLRWREGAWEADPKHVHESAWRKTLAAARRARPGTPPRAQLAARLLRGYRILFSRAIRGVYVWFEDGDTRAKVERALLGPG